MVKCGYFWRLGASVHGKEFYSSLVHFILFDLFMSLTMHLYYYYT